MDYFRFQQFAIQQEPDVFRIGTDAVLLGALASVESKTTALEVGCGCGIISLMLAQRNPYLQIESIDINPKAVALSRKNYENSVFSRRLQAFESDYKSLESAKKFDLIISNPPYFEGKNQTSKHYIARHQIQLNYTDLILKTAEKLIPSGSFSCIIPYLDRTLFLEITLKNALFLNREVRIKGRENKAYNRVVLEFSFQKTIPTSSELILEKSHRVYSDAYLQLTQDFHVFGSK